MTPQLLTDLPFPDYLNIAALSPSGAKHLLRSPAHYRNYIESPRVDTTALRIGRALHALALEGRGAYEEGFVVAPDVDRRTKEGKAAWAALGAAANGRAILSASEAETVEGVAAAVTAHPLAPAILRNGRAECSLTWTDAATGAPLKGRPDFLRIDDGAVVDLKTTLDASAGAFARACMTFGYHVQAAAYLEGLRALGHDLAHYLLIAVEKGPPHACAVYRLSDESRQLGAQRWRAAVAAYADMQRTGEAPGYPPHITELALPGWALADLAFDDAV